MSQTRKGADLIADYLIAQGVPYVFGVCGHGNVGMLDALYDRADKIKLISPRHEQCAGHMPMPTSESSMRWWQV